MVTNTNNTFYLHLCDDPVKVDIQLSNGITIQSAEDDEHLYPGMWFKNTASITEQMKFNLNQRACNIAKYHDWLDVNLLTPIYIKLHVLDSCMFLAYLYGCECW